VGVDSGVENCFVFLLDLLELVFKHLLHLLHLLLKHNLDLLEVQGGFTHILREGAFLLLLITTIFDIFLVAFSAERAGSIVFFNTLYKRASLDVYRNRLGFLGGR